MSSKYISHLIQSLPYLCLQQGTTHTWRGTTWMFDEKGVDGDDGGDLHSGRVPEQRSWAPNLGFVMAAELRKVSGKSDRGLDIFRSNIAYMQRGAERRRSRGRAAPGRDLGPTHGWDPPLLLGCPPSGSSGSVANSSKKSFLQLFWNFPRTFQPCTKERHQMQFC